MKFSKLNQNQQPISLPLYGGFVNAGFPSPAEDYMQGSLNLNDLIDNPSSTFMARVEGDSMKDAGIYQGDLLIVDKAKDAVSGDVIIGMIDGDFTLKRYILDKDEKGNKRITLRPENKDYQDIPVTAESDFEIWGVVICTLHNPNQRRIGKIWG